MERSEGRRSRRPEGTTAALSVLVDEIRLPWPSFTEGPPGLGRLLPELTWMDPKHWMNGTPSEGTASITNAPETGQGVSTGVPTPRANGPARGFLFGGMN